MPNIDVVLDTPEVIGGNRRSAQRHAFEMEMSYRCKEGKRTYTGTGTTIDFSSNGLSFRPDRLLAVGSGLTFRIFWPAPNTTVDLIGSGKVVRSSGAEVGVKVAEWSFEQRNADAPAESL